MFLSYRYTSLLLVVLRTWDLYCTASICFIILPFFYLLTTAGPCSTTFVKGRGKPPCAVLFQMYGLDMHIWFIECFCCKNNLKYSYLFQNYWNKFQLVVGFISFTKNPIIYSFYQQQRNSAHRVPGFSLGLWNLVSAVGLPPSQLLSLRLEWQRWQAYYPLR